MSPDINQFIMEHKQTLENFFGGVKIDSIASENKRIIFHKIRDKLDVSNKFLNFFFQMLSEMMLMMMVISILALF